MDSPRAVVNAFIADYLEWNRTAYQRQCDNPNGFIDEVLKLHQDLLNKFCEPGFIGEPIAFGSNSSHDPRREKIVFEEVSDISAVLRTTQRDENEFVADYEYRLVFKSNRWFLLAVDYIDADGLYPGL